MRLYTLVSADGIEYIGAETVRGRVHDITSQYSSMLELIYAGPQALEAIERYCGGASQPIDLANYRIIAPIPRPQRDLYCVGWNYLKHYSEGVGKRGNQETDLPEYPTFFNKATRSVIGPNQPVFYDSQFTERLDYEAEVAVIIGREGKNIDEADALDYIFGFTLANDVSARDVQRRHGGQWLKGKSMDGSCPLGPAIVTRAEVGAVEQLDIRGLVNGQVRQEARLSQLIFSIPRLIAELSRGMTLLPGDILLSGTPDGVGFAMEPPRFLKPGDQLVVESTALGRLESVVGPDIHEVR